MSELNKTDDDARFTAKDVARLIAYTGSEDEIVRIIRQVRHWTASELLRPVGALHPGTGNRRRYDANGVRCAALLLEITRYGVTVDRLTDFDEWFDLMTRHPKWRQAVLGKDDFLIEMAWGPMAEDASHWRMAPLRKDILSIHTPPAEPEFDMASAIRINVTKVFASLAL